jgi:hypothetical protein
MYVLHANTVVPNVMITVRFLWNSTITMENHKSSPAHFHQHFGKKQEIVVHGREGKKSEPYPSKGRRGCHGILVGIMI